MRKTLLHTLIAATATLVLAGCANADVCDSIEACEQEKSLHKEMMADLRQVEAPEALEYQRKYCGDKVGLAVHNDWRRCLSWSSVLASDGLDLIIYAEIVFTENNRPDLAEKWFDYLRLQGQSSLQKYYGLTFLRRNASQRGDGEAYVLYLLEAANLSPQTLIERQKISTSKLMAGDILYHGMSRKDPSHISIPRNKTLGLRYLDEAAILGNPEAQLLLDELRGQEEDD